MAFNFENLDETTRSVMLDEINSDVKKQNLYSSKRFNENGNKLYEELLKQAAAGGNEQTLANDLSNNDCFNTHESRQSKTGELTLVKVPINAHQTFAEGEFNRFYCRALCVIAFTGKRQLEVYRARPSENPRPESEAMIGSLIDPVKLLHDLQNNIGIDTHLKLPPGPNSGLSVRLV